MKRLNEYKVPIVHLDTSYEIHGTDALLDVIATVQYYEKCNRIIVHRESLGEAFFDLKTKIAGEILQKLMNYNMKIAIVGDFSEVQSNAFKDFIYECNKGKAVFFKATIEEGATALEMV